MNLSLLASSKGPLYTEDGLFGIANRGFTIFGLDIYWYAVCIVCGMILAAVLSALLMKRRNMSVDLIFLLFVVCIPTAIIGARLYACLADPNLGIERFFDFRHGGLSILGGVIGGVRGLVLRIFRHFFRKKDVKNVEGDENPAKRPGF